MADRLTAEKLAELRRLVDDNEPQALFDALAYGAVVGDLLDALASANADTRRLDALEKAGVEWNRMSGEYEAWSKRRAGTTTLRALADALEVEAQ